MATPTTVIEVPDSAALEARIRSYEAEGYKITKSTFSSVVMVKKGKFSIFWALIGLITAVNAEQQKDQVVEIRITGIDN